jgi:hypothetical protein
LPKPRPSILKRQREIAKREKREAKIQRKLARKSEPGEGPPRGEPQAPYVDREPELP